MHSALGGAYWHVCNTFSGEKNKQNLLLFLLFWVNAAMTQFPKKDTGHCVNKIYHAHSICELRHTDKPQKTVSVSQRDELLPATFPESSPPSSSSSVSLGRLCNAAPSSSFLPTTKTLSSSILFFPSPPSLWSYYSALFCIWPGGDGRRNTLAADDNAAAQSINLRATVRFGFDVVEQNGRE